MIHQLSRIDFAAHQLLDETLPTHPRTGLQAVGIVKGRPVWPILGGSEDGDGGDGDGGDDGDGSDDGDDSQDGDKPLGPQGERALQAEKEKRRQARAAQRQAEQERDQLRAELDRLKGDGDGAPNADQLREEAKREARAELLRERVADRIEAKAAKFADPADAVAIILRNQSTDDFIDDEDIDTAAIVKALDDLAKKKPHLLADSAKRFQGGADGGARKPAKSDIQPGLQRLSAAYADSGTK